MAHKRTHTPKLDTHFMLPLTALQQSGNAASTKMPLKVYLAASQICFVTLTIGEGYDHRRTNYIN